MATEWIYLLKVNAGITLFYAFYKLFCQKDTFFVWRRFVMLSFLIISFGYPILNIQHWIKEQPMMSAWADFYGSLIEMEYESTTPVTQTSVFPDLQTCVTYIYWTGFILLSIRFLIQVFSICQMRWKGEIMYWNNQRIISTPHADNPFSFFNWIFIHASLVNGRNFQEIMTHEQTHARQGHSVDVIISQIACIICWFNPFVWLLKNEIRLNLEYLADEHVTEEVTDSKQYQYHLLEIIQTKQTTNLYNYFNVLQLKKRIIMMNKKRTRMTGRIKYALFAPLAIALLLASNISCTSATENSTSTEAQVAEDHVFEIVEEPAEFPGGMAACLMWINDNLNYPTFASENDIQGRVYVSFVVRKDGSITDVKIARGVDPHLDKEALRVVSKMPKWKPGKQNGKEVNLKVTVPVNFKLM